MIIWINVTYFKILICLKIEKIKFINKIKKSYLRKKLKAKNHLLNKLKNLKSQMFKFVVKVDLIVTKTFLQFAFNLSKISYKISRFLNQIKTRMIGRKENFQSISDLKACKVINKIKCINHRSCLKTKLHKT